MDSNHVEKTENIYFPTPVNIREEVYKFLRDRILKFDYPPGYRFDLTELEQQLGISRTPLKEAMQRLEVDGLVDIRSRRGTFVTRIDPKEAIDNFRVRHALELYVARDAVNQASQTEINVICATNDTMRSLAKTNDFESIVKQYLVLDREFHKHFVALSRNERLETVFESVNVFLQLARVHQSFDITMMQTSQSEHDAIEQAFKQRDAHGLIRAVDNHLEASITRLARALENQFEDAETDV